MLRQKQRFVELVAYVCWTFVHLLIVLKRNLDKFWCNQDFLRATACNAIARLCYTAEASFRLSFRLSVCPSHCCIVKTTKLRIMKSSPCDSLESLVSNEVILVPLAVGEEIPIERGHQRGVPPLEIVILPLLAHLA